jgi:hypothetical protein
MLIPTNPGDPELCLSLPGCGPFGEDSTYVSASGDQVQGTRRGLGPDYGSMTAQRSIGNSNYNALEANIRYTSGQQQVSVGYTFSKSIDQGSNLGEQLNPIDQKRTRAISAFDLRQNLMVSYTTGLPFRRLFSTSHTWAIGWSLAGTMRASSGFPVTLYDNSDNSLMGTLGNGVNNYLLDTPNYAGGRSTSIRMAATGGRHSIRHSSAWKSSVSSETFLGVSSMDPGRSTSTQRSAK